MGRYKKIAVIILLGLFIPFLSAAQEVRKDSTERDSLRFYKLAAKRKITYWLYLSIFVDPTKGNHVVSAKKKSTNPEADPFLKYKDKIIRHIDIVTLDPFGTSIEHLTEDEKDFFKRTANALHKRSTTRSISNQLLFEKGDRLDPLILRETERLIRQQEYIHDAQIRVKPVTGTKDSVDLLVVAKDRWSLTGAAAFNLNNPMVRLKERNFLGLGHRFENALNYNFKEVSGSKLSLNGNYSFPLFRKSYINATAYYGTNFNNSHQGISINRPFYSIVTKWAGGINLFRNNTYSYFPIDTFPLQFYQQDVWLGRSFKLGTRNEADRSSAIVVAGRMVNTDFIKRPGFDLDTFRFNQDNTLYLGTIGFSARRYYKDAKIYQFGTSEDVPEGRSLALVGGIHQKEFNTEYYSGIRLGAGNHLPPGYFTALVEYGTYFNNEIPERGVFNSSLAYFSDLINMNRWNIRKFISIRYTKGLNRASYESINLNGDQHIYGFSTDLLQGNTRLTANLESIVYTPLNVFGFKLATIFFAGFGLLGNEPAMPLFDSHVYQAYGLGFLIRNEQLVFNTIQFSFGIYPDVPGEDELMYRFNALRSYNLRFRDFDVGRPELIGYH